MLDSHLKYSDQQKVLVKIVLNNISNKALRDISKNTSVYVNL